MEQRHETLVFSLAILAMTAGAMAIEPWPGILRVRPQVVHYGDLDLAKPANVATLHARLRDAADHACRLEGRSALSMRIRETCRDRLIEQGLAAMPARVQAYPAEWKPGVVARAAALSAPCSRTGCSRPGS